MIRLSFAALAVAFVSFTACGPQGTSVQGRTYVATSSTAVQNGYYNGNYGSYSYGTGVYGYSGYNPYGSGFGLMSVGETIRFVDNSRVEVRTSGGASVVSGTYYSTAANAASISVRLDTQSVELRFNLQNGGAQLVNQQTGQIFNQQ